MKVEVGPEQAQSVVQAAGLKVYTDKRPALMVLKSAEYT